MEILDFGTVSKIAIFMVGITQLLKQFFDVQDKRIKILITIGVGVIGSLILKFLNPYIFTTMVGISTGVIFYDYILKKLEKLFSKDFLENKGSGNEHPVESAEPSEHLSATER